jgi:hypothetical protein
VSAVSAAIAASVTMAGEPHFARLDCVVVNRFAMPFPGRNACPRAAPIKSHIAFFD